MTTKILLREALAQLKYVDENMFDSHQHPRPWTFLSFFVYFLHRTKEQAYDKKSEFVFHI